MSEQQVLNGLGRVQRDLIEVAKMQVQLERSVAQVATGQDQTRIELSTLAGQFNNFVRQNELDRALQLAQTRIIEIRQELETKFGHYTEVRNLANGTLQAMDAGIVTTEVLREVSEERMLTTPRYWLPPALLALAAWIRDDRRLADRALGEALRRDNDKTALFFALVLCRHGREGASARWIEQYAARQDPATLSRDFTVIVDAVASGVLGVSSRPVLLGTMDGWYERLRRVETITTAQVDRWRTLLEGMRPALRNGFTVLPSVSPTWPVLLDLLERAAVHGRADAHFRTLFTGPPGASPDIRARVDDILDNLVRRFDDEEAPHRRAESEQLAIIAHHGDVAAARTATRAEAAVHETETDLLTLLTNAAFFPDQTGVCRGTQRLAVALTKDWIAAADGQLEAANVAAMPSEVVVTIEGWTGRVTDTATEAGLAGGLSRHIDTETAAQEAAVKLSGGGMAATVGAIAAVFLAIVAFAKGSVGGGGFLIVCGLALGVGAAVAYSKIPDRRRAVRAAGEARKAQAVATLRGALAETVDWRAAWATEIGRAAPFRVFIGGLAREAHVAATPAHHRGV
jgi:hypothetical protein